MGRKYDALAASLLSAAEFYEACVKDYERAASDDRTTIEQRAVYRGRSLAYANAARYMRTMLKSNNYAAITGEQMRTALELPPRRRVIPVAWAGTLLEGVDVNDERAVRQALAPRD